MSSDLMLGLILACCAVNMIGLLILAWRQESRSSRREDFERRVAVLEQSVRQVPSHADISSLRDRISGLSGQISGLSDRQASAADMIRTIQTHLLEKDR